MSYTEEIRTESSLPQEGEGLEANALYEGDTGSLSFEQRQLMVTLLRGPYLTQAERPNLWQTVRFHRGSP